MLCFVMCTVVILDFENRENFNFKKWKMKKGNPPHTLAKVGYREVFLQTYRSDRVTVKWTMNTLFVVQLEIEKLYFILLYFTWQCALHKVQFIF